MADKSERKILHIETADLADLDFTQLGWDTADLVMGYKDNTGAIRKFTPDGTATFIALQDTPNDYSNAANSVVCVANDEKSLQFIDAGSFGRLITVTEGGNTGYCIKGINRASKPGNIGTNAIDLTTYANVGGATGDYSFSVSNSIASGDYAASFNNGNASATHATAFGSSFAKSDYTVAVGNATSASGNSSMSGGHESSSYAPAGFTYGYSLLGDITTGQCVVGAYNIKSAGAFVVGAGTSSTRKNGLLVTATGKVQAPTQITSTSISENADVITLGYLSTWVPSGVGSVGAQYTVDVVGATSGSWAESGVSINNSGTMYVGLSTTNDHLVLTTDKIKNIYLDSKNDVYIGNKGYAADLTASYLYFYASFKRFELHNCTYTTNNSIVPKSYVDDGDTLHKNVYTNDSTLDYTTADAWFGSISSNTILTITNLSDGYAMVVGVDNTGSYTLKVKIESTTLDIDDGGTTGKYLLTISNAGGVYVVSTPSVVAGSVNWS